MLIRDRFLVELIHGIRQLLATRRARLRIFLLAVEIGLPFPFGIVGAGRLGDGGLRCGEGLGHRALDRGRFGRRGTRAGSGPGQRGVGAGKACLLYTSVPFFARQLQQAGVAGQRGAGGFLKRGREIGGRRLLE